MGRLGNLGVHTLEELQTFTARVSTAQRRKRHLAERPARTRPASTCSATTSGRVLYVGTSRDLRTRVRTYFTASETPRRGWARWSASPSSVTGIECATTARGRGPRAAADRRAQAALQPPLPLPREGRTGSSSRSSRGPGCRWSRTVARRRGRLPRPVLVAARRRGAPSPRCTRPSRSASAASRLSPKRPRAAPAPSPRWVAASPRATAPERRRTTPRSSTALRDASCGSATRDAVRRAPGRGWARCPAAERFEDAQVVRDRLVAFVRGATRTQRLAALHPVPRARRRPAVGHRRLGGPRASGTGASRRRASSPPGAPTPMPYVGALCASAETSWRRPRTGAGRHRRGDREGPAVAGVARRAPRRRRRGVDLPGRRGRRAPRAARAPGILPSAHRRLRGRPLTGRDTGVRQRSTTSVGGH